MPVRIYSRAFAAQVRSSAGAILSSEGQVPCSSSLPNARPKAGCVFRLWAVI
jgi:hypothetical protein